MLPCSDGWSSCGPAWRKEDRRATGTLRKQNPLWGVHDRDDKDALGEFTRTRQTRRRGKTGACTEHHRGHAVMQVQVTATKKAENSTQNDGSSEMSTSWSQNSHGKGDLRILRWREHPELPRWAQSNYRCPLSTVRGRCKNWGGSREMKLCWL